MGEKKHYTITKIYDHNHLQISPNWTYQGIRGNIIETTDQPHRPNTKIDILNPTGILTGPDNSLMLNCTVKKIKN